jgi:hypothetical protein
MGVGLPKKSCRNSFIATPLKHNNLATAYLNNQDIYLEMLIISASTVNSSASYSSKSWAERVDFLRSANRTSYKRNSLPPKPANL